MEYADAGKLYKESRGFTETDKRSEGK